MLNKNTKLAVFFVVVFVAILVSGSVAKDILQLSVIAVFVTLGLYLLYHFGKLQKDGFRFEVTPEKRCRGGPYMHQDDPYCKKLFSTEDGCEDYLKYNCQPGLFHGFPKRQDCSGCRQRTPMSNSHWKNTMCDKQ
jgi:hypothetical protein